MVLKLSETYNNYGKGPYARNHHQPATCLNLPRSTLNPSMELFFAIT